MKIRQKRQQKLNEPRITHVETRRTNRRRRSFVKMLERPIPTLMERNQERHHRSDAVAELFPGVSSLASMRRLPFLVSQKKVVYFTEKCYDFHQRTPLWVIEM